MAGKLVSKAKVASVIKSGTLSTDDLAEREHTTSAEAKIGHLVTSAILRPEVDDVVLAGEDIDAEYLATLKFNEEIVELTIAEDSSEFPIDPVSMSVQGKQIFVYRGVPTKVQRKYIECITNPLLRVKTRKVVNNLGEDATVLDQTRSLQFPFQLNDPNPKGRAWLRALLTRG